MDDPGRFRPAWAARLRAQRRERCWSQRELARHLAEAAGEDTRRTLPGRESIVRLIKSYEAGNHQPRDPYRILYCRVFDMAEAELFAAEDAPSMPPQSRPSAVFDGGSFPRDAVPTTQGRVDDALVESLFVALADSAPRVFDRKRPPGDRFIRKVPDGDDMERRVVTQILTTLTAGAAIPMDALEILRSGLGRVLGATDDLAVEDWERTAYDHACALRVMSPAALIGYLSADIAELQHALDRRPDLDRVRMRRVGAQFAALMAMALSETGDFLTASRWWRIARRTADASGDRELSIWTLGRQALVAQTIGMNTLALRLLRDVEQLADDRPSCGLAEALTTRAKLDGSQDAESARRALDELRDLFERLPADVTGERAAIWGYPEERLLSVRTGVLTAIGDADVMTTLPVRSHAMGRQTGAAVLVRN